MTDTTCLADGVCEVTLETSDRSALEAFYTSALGLKVLSREADRTWLACGSRARLGLWTPGEKEFGDEGGRHVHFALSVSPGVLNVVCGRLRELGVEFQGPVEHPGGDRSLYCEDPAGNVLELWDFFQRLLEVRVPVGNNARRGLAGFRRLAVNAAGYTLGLALAGVSALRRGKAVHPHGAVYAAELVVPSHRDALGRTELLGTPGHRPALVRFSRSLGLPRPLPDLLGMSLRVPDAYGAGRNQDFLMVSSIDAPVMHHLFAPARDVQQRPYSSSLPYRAGDETFIVGILPRPDSPRVEGGNELERLAAAAATGALVFDLAVADVWGRFRPVAELRVRDPLPPETDALRFNPWNAGGGLEPTGLLNRLRDYAYPLSQRAWGRARRANDQAAAEAAVQRRLRL